VVDCIIEVQDVISVGNYRVYILNRGLIDKLQVSVKYPEMRIMELLEYIFHSMYFIFQHSFYSDPDLRFKLPLTVVADNTGTYSCFWLRKMAFL
jgi:hypothetical protein